MKMTVDDLNTTFKSCMRTGKIKEKVVDIELIRSLKIVAEKGLDFINRQSTNIPKDSPDWTFVFRDHYESLRGLIEALLLFDGIEVDNHQCKNAYLCHNHPELNLDWEFLEIIRLKRNAINYRGQFLKYDDWMLFKMKFDLYVMTLRKTLEKKLL